MGSERRQHPRLAVRLLVQHQSTPEAAFEVDYATDLSQGGFFLNTTQRLEPNATLHVQFAPARDARVVEAFCRVARITPQGVGATFLSLDGDGAALIAEVLASTPLPKVAAEGAAPRAFN